MYLEKIPRMKVFSISPLSFFYVKKKSDWLSIMLEEKAVLCNFVLFIFCSTRWRLALSVKSPFENCYIPL